MLKKIRKISLAFLFLSLTVSVNAQGSLKGLVKDKSDSEPLIGASVFINGLVKSTITNVDGQYEFKSLPAGTYDLKISYVSYQTQQHIGVVIENGKTTLLDIEMLTAEVSLHGVQIVGFRRTNTEIAMLNSTKITPLVVSGISSQQIARTLDRDAGEVVKRVPGVTIMDNRFVVVRGLNQRYNNVWLNDVSTPSSEADSRAFSFDAIPGSMIDNILIYKTPAPEIPADFSGGFVKITTKNLPTENLFSIGFGMGYDFNSTFKTFESVSRTPLDLLGLGYSARRLPTDFPEKIKYNMPSAEKIGYTSEINKGWDTKSITAMPDLKLSANLQHLYKIWEHNLGHIASLSYSNSFKTNAITNRRFGVYRQDVDKPSTKNDYVDNQYVQDSKLGILSNWTYELQNGRIEFRNIFNQIGKSRYTLRNGQDNNNGYILKETENFYMSRTTFSSQLSGKHQSGETDSQIDWVLGYSFANRNEPDRKIITYRLNQDSLSPGFGNYRTFGSDIKRFYQNLSEHVVSGGANWDKALSIGDFTPKLKVGIFNEFKYRTFAGRNFIYNLDYTKLPYDYSYLGIDALMTDANIQSGGALLQENSNKSDSYSAYSLLDAGYVGLNMPAGDKLKIYVGIRAERNMLVLNGYESDGTDPVNINRTSVDLFPSVNATYNLNETNLFRLAYGNSINRPEFREVAPYVYYDFEQFANFEGNSTLKDAHIQNFDFRYEWYPTPSEAVSVALFWKHFKNPIETSYFEVGGQTQFTYKNAESARNFGIEIDLRKNLSFIGLEHLNLVLNTSFIQSKVFFPVGSFERDRAMQGQSPYLVNVGVFYDHPEKGLKASLMYNRIGKRILYVGIVNQNIIQDIPDTYEMPRNVVDLSVAKKITDKIEIGLGIRDLLSEPIQYKQFPLYQSGSSLIHREQTAKFYNSNRNIALSFKMDI